MRKLNFNSINFFPADTRLLDRSRTPLACVALLIALLAIGGCKPSEYPSRTITIVCPWAQGGGTDRNSRFWASALEDELGQRVVVVNRTGGSGAIGHGAGANAKPDGYTLTMITAELSTMHRMDISELTYEDYIPIVQMNADAAAILVKADSQWQSLGEFLDQIREEPGTLKMTGTATAGTWDLARAGLLHAAGIPVDDVTWVPTDGAAPSLTKLLGGHVDAVCCSLPEAEAQLEAGQLKALAVMSEEPLSDYPDVPTCRMEGVDWVAVGWRGLAVPNETPDEIVQQLKEKAEIIVESDEFEAFMKENKFGIAIRTGDEFESFLADQDELWKPVIEAAGYAR